LEGLRASLERALGLPVREYWAGTKGVSQGLKPPISGGFDVRAEEGAEKVAVWRESVPQRLKPDCKGSTYGTDKSVPLSKTEAKTSSSAASKVRTYLRSKYNSNDSACKSNDSALCRLLEEVPRGLVAGAVGGLLGLGLVVGCASPGPPLPPSLKLPRVVTDLTVARNGDEVKLHWTTPERTTDAQKIVGAITAEICRDLGTALQTPQRGANGQSCSAVGHVSVQPGVSEWSDVLPAGLMGGATRLLAYRVQLVNAAGHTAGPSTAAFTVAGLAPLTVEGLHGTANKAGAVLEWRAESGSAGGDVVELDRITATLASKVAQAAPVEKPRGPGREKTPVEVRFRAGDTGDAGGMIDRTAVVGETYRYTAQRVRVVVLDGHTVEVRSAASESGPVAMLDVFPPNVPEGLVASPGFVGEANGLPEQGQRLAIDLSWEPGMEARIAGYRVYRRDRDLEGDSGVWRRLNSELVAMPSYRDLNVVARRRFAYRVTAVDEAGNESGPSGEIEETAPVR